MIKTESKGVINIVVILVLALIALKLVGIDVTDVLDQPWFKDFAIWLKNMLYEVWKDILEIFAFVMQAK